MNFGFFLYCLIWSLQVCSSPLERLKKKGEKAAALASLPSASAFEGCSAMPFIVRLEAVPWS